MKNKVIKPVVKAHTLETGETRYQPCLFLSKDEKEYLNGELFFDDFILCETMREASEKAYEMLNSLMEIIKESEGQIA